MCRYSLRWWQLVNHLDWVLPWRRKMFLWRDLLSTRFFHHLHLIASFVLWKERYFNCFLFYFCMDCIWVVNYNVIHFELIAEHTKQELEGQGGEKLMSCMCCSFLFKELKLTTILWTNFSGSNACSWYSSERSRTLQLIDDPGTTHRCWDKRCSSSQISGWHYLEMIYTQLLKQWLGNMFFEVFHW